MAHRREREGSAARARLQSWRHWGGVAAGVLLAFGVGWTAHSEWLAGRGRPADELAQLPPLREFAREAALAHAVYQPEVRHPVEVAAVQQEHLVQWLSKRLDRPLHVPSLTREGYELVGGRLLPGDAGARAQFMFQDARGTRITLYLGAVPASDARGAETAFRLSTDGPVPAFYWVDQGFGYALSGPLPRDELLRLARAVHAQL